MRVRVPPPAFQRLLLRIDRDASAVILETLALIYCFRWASILNDGCENSGRPSQAAGALTPADLRMVGTKS